MFTTTTPLTSQSIKLSIRTRYYHELYKIAVLYLFVMIYVCVVYLLSDGIVAAIVWYLELHLPPKSRDRFSSIARIYVIKFVSE